MIALTGCSAPAGDGGGGGTENDGTKIGVVLRTLTTPQWQEVVRGVEDEAGKLGYQVEAYGGKSEQDTQGQINAIEDLLVKGVSALIVSANGSTQLQPVLEKARSQGVSIIFLDAPLPDLEGDSLIVSDNRGISKRLSETFIEDQNLEGRVGLLGFDGIQSVDMRVEGATEAIEAAGLEVATVLPGDCDRTKSIGVTEDMLQANPDITAIWGNCDAAAYGAIQAVKAAGKVPGQDIQIVGFDGQDEALAYVESGELWGTVVQDFFGWGQTAVQLIADIQDGKDVEKTTLLDATIVTRENVADFLK